MNKIRLVLAFFFLSGSAFCQNAHPMDVLIDAMTSFEGQDYEAARDSLEAVIQQDSTVDAAYYYLALLDYSAKDMEAAGRNFRKAVELDSTNNWYMDGLASYYSAIGDQGGATEIYLRLLEKEPRLYRNSYTLTLLADQKLAQGQDSLALEYYNQALVYDEEYIPAKLGLIDIYLQKRDYVNFFPAVKEVISNTSLQEGPKEQYLTSIMRNFPPLFWQKWKKEIKDIVTALVQCHGGSMDALGISLQVNMLYGDTAEAINDCRSMVLAAGDDKQLKVPALTQLGDLLHEAGEEKAAFEAYRRAIALDPEYTPALNNYAYFLSLKRRQLRKALKMSAVTVGKEPDNPTYLDTYGWILYLLHKPEKAKPVFKHALIYGGKDNAEVLRHYAEVLDALGEKDLADFYRMQVKDK